jgi:hypothetical protein
MHRSMDSRPRSSNKRYGSTSGSPSACVTSKICWSNAEWRCLMRPFGVGESFRTDDRGRLTNRRLKPHTTWHLDEIYLKIDGHMVYLWRAVDTEGEVPLAAA